MRRWRCLETIGLFAGLHKNRKMWNTLRDLRNKLVVDNPNVFIKARILL
jgi:hypothetical protein